MLFHGRNFSFWIRVAIFVVVIQLSGCFPGFPEPDCGGILDLVVNGKVTDENSKPISGALMRVESLEQNACTGSQSIPEFTLTSNEMGYFNGIIPVIYIDDVIRIEVSADGFKTYSYNPATYTFFDQEFVIVLRIDE